MIGTGVRQRPTAAGLVDELEGLSGRARPGPAAKPRSCVLS